MANTMAKVITLVAGAGLTGTTAVADGSYHGYEAPSYTVEKVIDGAEVRSYAPHLLAVVRVEGERSAALRQGFQILAGYIFGGNQGAAKVAMTTPVAIEPEKIAMTVPVTQARDGNVWQISFMMPAAYTRDTLPKPNSDAIRFEEAPGDREIVLTFSGWATAGRIARHEEELRGIAASAGLTLAGPLRTYYYDDPFTLPWNRRNEVAFALR